MKNDTIHLELTVTGQRLDSLLAEKIPDASRAQIQQWIKQGLLTDAGGTPLTQASLKLKQPLKVVLHRPIKEPFALPVAEERPEGLRIVFEDEHLIVLDKPVGLTVHPGAGRRDGTLVNMLLGHTKGQLSDIGTHERPGIVHRLDKDTGGLMLVAKTNQAHNALAEALQQRKIHRHYQALVWGFPQPMSGMIEAPIGRDPKNRQRMAITASGKSAVTHYTVLRAFGGTTFAHVACRLETGRTHQIRVHLTSIGHPIIGDKTYVGRIPRRVNTLPSDLRQAITDLPGQMLYAAELIFEHPITGAEHHFTAQPPENFTQLLALLGRL